MKNDRIREYLDVRYGKRLEVAERPGYTVRPISLKHLSRDLESLRDVNNDAFAANWRFLPLSREEVAFSAKYLRLVTRPNFILIAEHLGRPVGVLHCVLDINPALKKLGGRPGPLNYLRFLGARKRIKKVIIFTVAIKNAYQHSRVYYLLLSAFARIARRYRNTRDDMDLARQRSIGQGRGNPRHDARQSIRHLCQGLASMIKALEPRDWGLGTDPQGRLAVGEIPAVALAREFGTPLHVIHEPRLEATARNFRRSMETAYPGRASVHYAFKCNSVPAVVSAVRRAGLQGRSHERIRARAGPPDGISRRGYHRQRAGKIAAILAAVPRRPACD